MNKIRDLQLQRFGRLVVVCKVKRRSNAGTVIWLCRCNCGNLKEVRSSDLVWGGTKSCGCLNKERRGELSFKHGDAIHGEETRIYRIWGIMKKRCLDPKSHNYKYYGGRGVSICREWLNNYSAFKFWALLSGYADNLTIDRINHKGNYEPSNCQWITASENSKKSWRERKI